MPVVVGQGSRGLRLLGCGEQPAEEDHGLLLVLQRENVGAERAEDGDLPLPQASQRNVLLNGT